VSILSQRLVRAIDAEVAANARTRYRWDAALDCMLRGCESVLAAPPPRIGGAFFGRAVETLT
jgi:hypothetical protein